MEEDADHDIYADLPDFRYDETLEQLNASIAKLEAENQILQTKLKQVAEEKQVLKVKYGVVSTHISSLIKTSKLEIQRKDRTITDLREQLNKMLPTKRQYGCKRRRETIVSASPQKRRRVSPKKVSISAHKTRSSTIERSRHHEKSRRKGSRTSRDEQGRRRCDSGKENAPVDKEASEDSPAGEEKASEDSSGEDLKTSKEYPADDQASKDSPAGDKKATEGSPANQLAPPEIPKDPHSIPGPSLPPLPIPSSPAALAPSVPVLECPTLFSARMYKRLYGRDHVTTTPPTPTNSMVTSEMVPTTVINQGRESPEPPERERTPEIAGSCHRLSKSTDTISASSDEIDNSPTQSLYIKPFVTSYSVLPPCIDASPSVTNVLPKPLSSTDSESPKENAPSQERVEPVLAVIPSEKTDRCLPINSEIPCVKSRIPGLLSMCKPRIQSPVVRPIQQFTTLETTPGKEPANYLIDGSPKPVDTVGSKNTVNAKDVDQPSPDRHLKIPALPGSVKGRAVRKVFAPISHQWNLSSTTGDEQNGSKRCTDETPCAQTITRTNLTVRVDESRIDGGKQSLAEAIFGSPVKWADDSSDCTVAEGQANLRKTYSIFGSPLKSLDSNSSDHPFSVPPGAYEDSCWTNTTVDKPPSKISSDGIQNVSQKCQEPVSGADNKPIESCVEPGVDKSTETSICPPPLLSVIKKHKSIFSPLKDTRLSVPGLSEEPSRSNAGIFFPFPRPKYEDTVLGQFDDTAQFVSALAKIDTRISPLSTPVKSGEESSSPSQSVIVRNNPTSFKEVFQKKIQSEGALGKPADPDVDSSEILSSGPSSASNKQHECGKQLARDENSRRQEIVKPPTITVTPPPKIDNLRIIHRPNFASSTIFESKSGVKSWFPNAPAKIVTPRKTPRLVSSVSRSASPKGFDVSVGARVAINDAFLIEQEERVRRWELGHMYENNIRSTSGSPNKSVSGSPTRKKVDHSGKVSPLKRYKNHASPNKSPRRLEFRKNLGVEPTPQISGNEELHSDALLGRNKVPNLNLTPTSANQIDTEKNTVDSCRLPAKQIQSLVDTTPMLMDMLNALLKQTKRSELEKETAPSVVDTKLTPVGILTNADAPNNSSVVENASNCPGIENPSTSAVTDEPVTGVDPAKPSLLRSEDLSHPAAQLPAQPNSLLSVEQTLVAAQPAPASTAPPSDPSIIANEAKSSHNPKYTIVRTCKKGVKRVAHKNKLGNNLSSTGLVIPSRPTALNDNRDSPEVESKGDVEPPVKESTRRNSKYNSIISRVKPSTPLHITVAARISSSISSSSTSRSYLKITAPVQSTKSSHFKRPSALKPLPQKIERQSQAPKDAEVQKAPSPNLNDTVNVQGPEPRLLHGRSIPNLSCTTNEVQNVNHDHTVPSREEKNDCKEPVVLPNIITSVEPTENSQDNWKIHEIDFQPVDGKPFSLWQKFFEAKVLPTLPYSVDSEAVTNSSTAKSTGVAQPGSDFAPSVCSTPAVKPENRVVHEHSNAHFPIANGVKVLDENCKFPPSSNLTRSPRKAILLDSPMRLELPAKGAKGKKLSEESGSGQTPERKNAQDVPETLKKSSSKKSTKGHVSPERESRGLKRKSQDTKRAISPDRRNRSLGHPGHYASPKDERSSRHERGHEHPRSHRRKSPSNRSNSSDQSSAGPCDRTTSRRKIHSREKEDSSTTLASRRPDAKSHRYCNSCSHRCHSPERSPARRYDRSEVGGTRHRKEKSPTYSEYSVKRLRLTSSKSEGRTSDDKSKRSKPLSNRHSPGRSPWKPDQRRLRDKASSESSEGRSSAEPCDRTTFCRKFHSREEADSSTTSASRRSDAKSHHYCNSCSHRCHSTERSPARRYDCSAVGGTRHRREKSPTCSEYSVKRLRLTSSKSAGRTSHDKSKRSKPQSNRHSPVRFDPWKPDHRKTRNKASSESSEGRSTTSPTTSSEPSPEDKRLKYSSSVTVLKSKSVHFQTPLQCSTTKAPSDPVFTPSKRLKVTKRPANFGASTPKSNKVLSLEERPALFSST